MVSMPARSASRNAIRSDGSDEFSVGSGSSAGILPAEPVSFEVSIGSAAIVLSAVSVGVAVVSSVAVSVAAASGTEIVNSRSSGGMHWPSLQSWNVTVPLTSNALLVLRFIFWRNVTLPEKSRTVTLKISSYASCGLGSEMPPLSE